jgi:hypothetical protein
MFAQVGTLKEHWTALLACLAASFYFLFVVVRRETNPLPARAPPAGPLGRFADRLRLRSLCYVLALLLPPFAFGVAATLKYPRHYRDRDGTQLYTFVGAGAGSVTADFPNHPGTIDCASLGAEDVTNWYVYAAQQLKGCLTRGSSRRRRAATTSWMPRTGTRRAGTRSATSRSPSWPRSGPAAR